MILNNSFIWIRSSFNSGRNLLINTLKIFFHCIPETFMVIFLRYFLFLILVWNLKQVLKFFLVKDSLLIIIIMPSSLHIQYLIVSYFRKFEDSIRSDVARLLSEYFLLIFFVATSQFIHWSGLDINFIISINLLKLLSNAIY